MCYYIIIIIKTVTGGIPIDFITHFRNKKILSKLKRNGVSIPCSDAVLIAENTHIGAGTVILPGCIIKEGCSIGKDCVIGPNTVLYKTTVGNNSVLNAVQAEEAEIKDGVTAGPFVHIRPDSVLGDKVHCGNFVEVKNSVVGKNTHISHLTYVGDSDVGRDVNFGCGVVTVNFNGKTKNRCKICDEAFIGCNTNLVAPVKVGERAYTAAGSTITADVPADALAVARERQINKENWVIKKDPYRKKK